MNSTTESPSPYFENLSFSTTNPQSLFASTIQDTTTSPSTTTTRKRFSRSTRTRPTRSTSQKTKTTKPSSNNWLFLTNATTISLDTSNAIKPENSNGFVGCNLS
jgi:hypothetical protein